ncbi:recombinase family protein [Campylobacter upsaliensis]|nr:resolvase [Campylobacter upsaliensis]EAK8496634.1 resolvase [Campylobacter jejuni]EAH6864596.1 resolvase [Campylobacter upsaliensis]EAI8674477.1 resolvase [Campylobacter upsaliensis]EAJ9123058.1 resolvase [Campylobacter upsaliensis]
MVIAYARVSTDKQDNISQEKLIKDYCKAYNLKLDNYISVEMSSRKSLEKRRINDLYELLKAEDTLITAELSRLGRDMFETITLINSLINKGVKVLFIRQPELSLISKSATKLLLSFYAYMAEYEREMISERTKAGLNVARSKGKILGRPVGSYSSMYDEHLETIKELIDKELSLKSIWKYIGKKGHYVSFFSFCKTRGLINPKNELNSHLKLIKQYRENGMSLNVIFRTLENKLNCNKETFYKLCEQKGIK